MAKLKPYAEYKDSGLPWLGRMPAHWEVRRNGRVFAQRVETGFPDLPILEVSPRTGVQVRDLDNTNRKQLMSNREQYKRAARGDIAYNMMRMWQGAVGVVPSDGLVSPAYIVARPFPETDGRYYSYLFRTTAYMNEVNTYSRGIVNDRNRLYWDEFKQMPSIFPPPDEQRKIADVLDFHDRTVRRFIRAKRRLIELLNEQKQAIIHRTLTRGLDPHARFKPSGIEWLGEVPAHWEILKIGHLAKVGNGSTPSRSNGAYWAESGYPWLNSSCVNQGYIRSAYQYVTDLALQECHLPRVVSGSVLVAITGQGRTRGTAAVLGIEATINQHIGYISLQNDVISSEYLRMFLCGMYVWLRAISDDSGSTRGALTCQDLKRFQIVVPPREEQSRIIASVQEILSEIDTTLARVDREIGLIREYRTRLIADVVTGKLDVRGVELPALDEAEELDDSDDREDVAELAWDLGEVEAIEEEDGD